jgi:hypothetical protein
MPYIKTERRGKLNKERVLDLGREIAGPGELNYVLTSIINAYLYAIDEEISYDDLNEVVGVLANVQQEFYRRVVVPYEDAKIQQNGDVY